MSRGNNYRLHQLLVVLIMFFLVNGAVAQDNLTDIFVRKAVKEFVAKQYDKAINDLDQALTADPDNGKAKKLLAKCLERKASQLRASGDIESAKNSYILALQNDSTNAEAKIGLAQIESLQVQRPTEPVRQNRVQTPESDQVQHVYPPQAPVIVTTPSSNFKADSAQAKLISEMMVSFQQQQQIMAQQLASSSDLMKSTDAQKERYLEALIKSSEQKSGMMREFIVVGAVVVVLIIIIALIVFIFIFGKYSRASELRTIQATEALQALMANHDIKQLTSQESPLMLAGPSGTGQKAEGETPKVPTPYPEGETIKKGVIGIPVEALSDSDPAVIAKNIEMLESEIANSGTEKPEMAPKIARLRELLNDPNNRVRGNAAKAFYLIDQDIALNNLKEMLNHQSSRSRASAIWSLGEIGSLRALETIVAIDKETDEIVCYNIRMALQKFVSSKTCAISDEMEARIGTLIEHYTEAI